ncbi:MAG: phosphate starvation-inducible protein PsiF [Deltaproteobacteria bacterium]|nr:phosphate starvation-inducible protein PsiF [Deltaproteobacteria bacterium]
MRKVAMLVLAGCLFVPQVVRAAEKKPNAQQEKMKACNKEATDKKLKGDERKKFMSECLKAKPAEPQTPQERMKSCNKEAGEKKLKGDERKKFMSECLKKK